jgi:hypothetical protein
MGRVERIQDKELAVMTKIPLKALRGLSAAGQIPSAADLFGDGRYTYNIRTIRFWMSKGRHERLRPKAPARRGFVYVLAAEDRPERVKIGFAANVTSRIRGLQTGCPAPLRLVASVPATTADERRLHHETFPAYREHGEWFRREGDVAAWIEAGCPL